MEQRCDYRHRLWEEIARSYQANSHTGTLKDLDLRPPRNWFIFGILSCASSHRFSFMNIIPLAWGAVTAFVVAACQVASSADVQLRSSTADDWSEASTSESCRSAQK